MALHESHIPGPSWTRRSIWAEKNKQTELRRKAEREMEAQTEGQTNTATPGIITEVISPKAVVALKTRTHEKTAAVVEQAKSIAITDSDTYQEADILLARVRQAKKSVESIMEPIIRPIRQGLDKLYALNRDLNKPIEEAEVIVKAKMGAYKQIERRRIEEEQRKKAEEERRLQAEADRQRRVEEEARQAEADAARRAQEARTATERAKAQRDAESARIASQRAALAVSEAQSQADAVSERVIEGPVKGIASKTVTKKKWVVKDISAVIAAVIKGEVPEIVLKIDEDVVNAYWENDRAEVIGWAGFDVEEVTTISGR